MRDCREPPHARALANGRTDARSVSAPPPYLERRRRACAALVLSALALAPSSGHPQATPALEGQDPARAAPATSAAGSAGAGSAKAGERLFSGEVRLRNRGPPCAACHRAAGLRFPGGGAMGPDLSQAYPKFGAGPLDVVLKTLFFPTMNPVFASRPLTPAERNDLAAFLAASAARGAAGDVVLRLLGAAVVLWLAAVATIAWLGRSRLRGVRAALVRARRTEGAP